LKALAFVLTVIVGIFLLTAANDLPDWGDPSSPASTHVSDYYIENSLEQTAVPNYVTSVLADYRGYDTMFETVVIFCAGITVYTVLRRTRRKKKVLKPCPDRENADIILQSGARILAPVMQLFALYVIAHGHHSPGGGFQGGVIFGASFILLSIAYDLKTVMSRIKEKAILLLNGLGVTIYAGIGFGCFILGENFLNYSAWSKILPFTPVMARSHGMLGVEIGVAVTVMSIMFSLYADLSSGGDLDEGL